MSAEILLAAYGLLSAVSWGFGDFSGGIASKRSPALTVVFYSQLLGGAMAVGLALARGETSLAPEDIAWAALGGLSGPAALVFFYKGLAVGRMGIVAPVAGVLGASVPVIVGGVVEGLPAPAQLLGIALGLLSVALVTRSTHETGSGRQGLGLAIIAGLGFGAFFTFMGQVHGGAVFAPLIVTRIVSTITIGAVVLVTHAPWRLSRPAVLPAVFAGTLDMSGNVWYLFASQQGRLDVAAVLSSLYPVVTVLLAAGFLREHVGRLQAAGIAAALAAIVLIAT